MQNTEPQPQFSNEPSAARQLLEVTCHARLNIITNTDPELCVQIQAGVPPASNHTGTVYSARTMVLSLHS